jgi:hypothetical protein
LEQPILLGNLVTLGGKLYQKFLETINWSGYLRYLTEIALKYVPINRALIPCNSRLSSISDKNGKQRIVAIFDYWSQTALKGLHDYLYKVLAAIPEDCTYEQGDKVSNWLTKEGPYYCLDLTSATDRFPASFQKDVLSKFIGQRRAQAWYSIMVDRDFVVPPHWGHPTRTVRYAVGQPLGAYSSWAAFTLAHHVLIRSCFHEFGIEPTKKYLVLGDDVVIANRSVARLYMKRLSELGVKTSPMKSLISRDTLEFAKRIWKKGVEISPIPVSGFVSTKHRIHLLVPFLVSLVKRGFGKKEEVPKRVSVLLSNLNVGRSSRLTFKALAFITVGDIIHGITTEVQGLKTLAAFMQLPEISCSSDLRIVSNAIFSDVVMRIRNKKSKTISFLIDIAEQLMEDPSPTKYGQEILNNNLVVPMSNVLEKQREVLIPWLEFLQSQLLTGGVIDLSAMPLDHFVIPSIDKMVREQRPDDIRNGELMRLTNSVLKTWVSLYKRQDRVLLAPSPDQSLMV